MFRIAYMHITIIRTTRKIEMKKISLINTFSAKGNIEVFANNPDSGESARNELSHLESALFAFKLYNYSKTLNIREMETPDF